MSYDPQLQVLWTIVITTPVLVMHVFVFAERSAQRQAHYVSVLVLPSLFGEHTYVTAASLASIADLCDVSSRSLTRPVRALVMSGASSSRYGGPAAVTLPPYILLVRNTAHVTIVLHPVVYYRRMSFADLVTKAQDTATDATVLPLLEIAKARRDGVANKYPRDAAGALIVPGASVSVTFEDGTSATAEVKTTSKDTVTVTVGGKSVQAKLETAVVTTPAGVDAQGLDELDREDAARVAWLSGRWPTADRLKQLREQQRDQPVESWVLHDKEVGSGGDVVAESAITPALDEQELPVPDLETAMPDAGLAY